ncbi:MAG: nitrite reductase small subunit NirD [Acidobacteria bacterium]|nr:nitrite reductase small subunit NirD [Acidobacteriota bacterium]
MIPAATGWVRVTAAADIPPREGRAVRLGGADVAIFNLGERFVAIENRCPHRGGPLADGIVSNHDGAITVTCPLHNWRICLESGTVRKPTTGPACRRSYPAKVEDGVVLVDLRGINTDPLGEHPGC